MNKRGGLVLRGSLLNAVLLFSNIAVSLYMMPFVVHALGDRWYGMWTLVATFMGYYGYLDFGLSVATQRFIAGAIGKQDHEEVSRLLTTALGIFAVLAAITLLVTLVVVWSAPYFFTDVAEIWTFRVVFTILGLSVAINFPVAAFNGLLTGNLRYDVATYIELGKLTIRTGLILYFIGAGYSIIALALIVLCVDVGGNVLKLGVMRRMFNQVGIRRLYFTRERLPELFNYGAKTFVNQLANLLQLKMDAPIIAAFINLSTVTLFNVGGQLVYYFRNLVINLTGVMVPVFAQFHATQNKKAIRHAYFFTSKLCTALSLLVGGAIIAFGKDFINLWMGSAYVQAYAVLLVLMIPTILYVSQQPALAVIYGLGEMGVLANASILVALVNIVMCIGLAGPLGMVGVALGIGIPMIFFSMFLIAFTVRLVQATVTDYLREVMGVFLVGGVMQYLSWYIVASLHIASYGDLIVSFLAIYPVQIVAILFLTFSTSEIQQIKETSLHALGFGGKA